MNIETEYLSPSDARTQQFLDRKKYQMFINNEWGDAACGQQIETINPATGELLGHFPAGDSEDIDRAVNAARHALNEGEWSTLTPRDREKLLWKLADLIDESFQQLAELETIDQGKPIYVSQAEIAVVSEEFRFFAGLCTKIEGQTFTTSIDWLPAGKEVFSYTSKEPVGVVGAIVPWNSPLIMAAFKLAPALAAGCTVVLKPAELTSLTTIRLAELIKEAGFPAGAVNIVTGYGHKAGAALAAHMDVDKIAFTGSTNTGRAIMDSAKSNLKKVTLELGGKSPMIFLEDCDIDAAIAGAANAITWNNGQICLAGSRLYAHKNIFEKIVAGVSKTLAAMTIGNPLNPQTAIGPMVSITQADRIMSYIQSGIACGAEAIIGGKAIGSGSGCYVAPTVLVNTNHDMTCVQEEIFGPALSCMPFEDINEVIKQANDSIYGLGASVWTENHSNAIKVSNQLKSGTVWINSHLLFDASLPIGGYKQSGFGRDRGAQAVENYLETKTIISSI
ncbi:MAG: phenylacetaldehyde dehydrogenase [Oceanicoccus sp.]|jgi:phenylacetaldehyde dehydrogenase